MAEELAIILQMTKFLEWILKHLEKFPRSHRYGIGFQIEQQLYQALEHLVEAKFGKDKSLSLQKVCLRLEQARLLIRISRSMRLFPLQSHQFASEQLELIGKGAGAWKKHADKKLETV